MKVTPNILNYLRSNMYLCPKCHNYVAILRPLYGICEDCHHSQLGYSDGALRKLKQIIEQEKDSITIRAKEAKRISEAFGDELHKALEDEDGDIK